MGVGRAGGAEEGFEEAFPALFARAYHVGHRILEHSGEAEDVAAEAMARALRSWRRVRTMRSPEAWVVRVATNLAIDIVRRSGRDRRHPVGEIVVRAEDIEGRLVMLDVLDSLPRRQRDVLALRYIADFSEADIAAALGIAPGSVKRHANRGITRLRARLEDGGEVLSNAS